MPEVSKRITFALRTAMKPSYYKMHRNSLFSLPTYYVFSTHYTPTLLLFRIAISSLLDHNMDDVFVFQCFKIQG